MKHSALQSKPRREAFPTLSKLSTKLRRDIRKLLRINRALPELLSQETWCK
jgi:hypothetical protein